jgi:multidrug efflux system outer membrane protein
MRRIFLISAASLLPLVAGCVTPNTVRTPAAQPPVAYRSPQPDRDSLTAAAFDNWWTLYGDAQLNALVDEALKGAPDARDAFARLEQAAAVRSGQIAQLWIPSGNPSVTGTHTDTTILESATPGGSGSGGGGSFITPGIANSLNANFNVSWELDLWGRRPAALRTVNADFFTAAFTYEATRTALIANVAQQLFQARGLALQLRDAVETARISNEVARIARVKFEHGLATAGEADQSAASAEAADAQVESLQAQLDAARRTLLVLIGRGFDPLESLPAAAAVGAPPPVPASVPGELLRRRPDVRAAEWKIVSASGTLRVNELAVLPTLKINPGISLAKSTGPFATTSTAWSVAGNLTMPILDRPRLLAQIRAQKAVAEQNVIAYERTVQTAYGDAETAFNYLQSDTKRVRMLTDAERRAESAYEKARVGYARGVSDLTAALQAETTWRNTRSQLTSAQTTQMQRSVQVFKALGGGWSPDQPAAGTPFVATASKGVGVGVQTDKGGR